MAERRNPAYAMGALTAAAYLVAPLLAPGPLTAARGVAALLSLWLGWTAARLYAAEERRAALPYRIAPTGPGLILAAALIGLVTVLVAYRAEAEMRALDHALFRFWAFPFSPVGMFAAETEGLAPVSRLAARGVAAALSVALALALAVAFIAAVAPIARPKTLRSHALRWKDDLEPDDFVDEGERVSGRLWLRAASLSLSALCLAYAPVFARMLSATHLPPIEHTLALPPLAEGFTGLWLISLWGAAVAAALIYAAAYLRLGFALAR